jgi:multimeric flavodoxin WrbA
MTGKDIRVLAINGSPRENGNTAHMLKNILNICEQEGFGTSFYQAGGRDVKGCKACGFCGHSNGVCSQDDWINELYPQMIGAHVILLGSPTYFGDLTPEIKSVIDRTGYMAGGTGKAFSRKIGAAVSAVRRSGGMTTLDSMQHFFLINDMIVPGSTYWNMSVALISGDYEQDSEGNRTMKRLGENIVWLVQKLFLD